MTTQLMETQTSTKPAPQQKLVERRTDAEPTIQEIISSARRREADNPQAGGKGPWIVSGATAALLWASFMPLDWGPLAWVALVPLLLLVRIPERTRWMYAATACGGVLWMVACLQWMRLGDPTMYAAWLALGTYCGLYVPVFVAVARTAVHRFRVPFTLAVPAVWVGLEFIRAHFLTGFSWYYLGHTQYAWLELIQISDLVGAYGVSFLVAMTAAVLAGLVPRAVFVKLRLVSAIQADRIENGIARKQVVSVAACLALFAAALSYGHVRRSQANFQPGPRVALIQGNYVTSAKHDPTKIGEIFVNHRAMTGMAVTYQPDVVIWPETMYRDPLKVILPVMTDDDIRRVAGVPEDRAAEVRKSAENTEKMLVDRSLEAGAAMVIGLETLELGPDRPRHYNSAAFLTPAGGLVNRYDKLHRVPFGEFIPMQKQFPWLIHFTPFTKGFGVETGEQAAVFEYKGRTGTHRGAPIICFEDTVPHLVRNVLNAGAMADEQGRKPDYLINLTNDGWFHGSAELDQHLITAAFRSVEYRTPMVRAVNTGISAVIDGDGAVVEPEVFIDVDRQGRKTLRNPETGRWNKSLNAVLVHDVPLDDRRSLYLWWGDWFAGLCAMFVAGVTVVGWSLRRRDRRAATTGAVAT
ncbi:MAG: apolipoprotein N-acyltransferase [Planctomycetaceae bacterium]